MISLVLALQMATLPVPEGCEFIRDGDHNAECSELALIEVERRLDLILLKIDDVTDHFSRMSADGGDPPEIDPAQVARAASSVAHEKWKAYRAAECAMQNVTLDEGYTGSVSYKQCLARLTNVRITLLEQTFGSYFEYLEGRE